MTLPTKEHFYQSYPDYEYNPFRDPDGIFYDKHEFVVKPKVKPIKTKYYATYKGVKPDLGLFGHYDVKSMTLTDALNLAVLRNDYGMLSYDRNKHLAYFYPFGNFANATPIEFKDNKEFDTYVKI